MTERLFDNDAYLWAFDAQVLSCVPRNEYFDVILDRTAFFPEGGGQPADQGTIDQARVLDVHESDGTIHHYTDRSVACGPVHCQLDAARRMDHMQQHSGEHIFSGLVFQHYGFHNVGFHMGTDAITMDFDGTLTREQAAQIESEVNEAIWKNLPVTVFYPSEHEEQNISYRAKKEIDGQLRLVCIEGYDLCACCGTHVSRTGEIGQVKIIGMIHYKRGVRISILCGRRALVYENRMLHDYHQAAHLLSAQEGSLGQSTQRLIQEREIDRQAAKHNRRMPVLIQVSPVGEVQKGGIAIDALRPFLVELSHMDALDVRGLMAVMPNLQNTETLDALFARMRALFEQMRSEAIAGIRMDELSMGMSHDYVLAARHGATMVRIGSALFGPRAAAPHNE